jgi:NAD(P)-dependent dehydrogenase (short-subunit alcohol dehydrogenase family)
MVRAGGIKYLNQVTYFSTLLLARVSDRRNLEGPGMQGSTSIEGKTAIITGATSGVGRSMARTWAARGANVIATGRRDVLGREVEKEARDEGHELTFVHADVSRSADCDAVVRTTTERHGRVDILVNNAGVEGPITDAHAMSDEEWDAVFDINMGGTFRMARAVLPLMKGQGGGCILNISSINADQALAHMAAYNASKAAIVQFSRTIAVEYLFDSIRSNAVILGGVRGGETGLRTQDGIARYVRGPEYERPTADEHDPLSQFVLQDPDEVATMLAVLCSDAMRLMTGASIALDRAMTAGFTSSTMIHMSTANLLQAG